MTFTAKETQILRIIEAAIFAYHKPLSIKQLKATVLIDHTITNKRLKQLLEHIQLTYQNAGIELVEVASGYRFQTKAEFSSLLASLWPENSPKYSRALLETLALIAYKQPITRGEIEQVRGVAVSSHIIKTLTERDWIKVVGHKEVAGRPALFATTEIFLDYFGVQSLADLPELAFKPLDVESQTFTNNLVESLSDSGESDVRKNSENIS